MINSSIHNLWASDSSRSSPLEIIISLLTRDGLILIYGKYGSLTDGVCQIQFALSWSHYGKTFSSKLECFSLTLHYLCRKIV